MILGVGAMAMNLALNYGSESLSLKFCSVLANSRPKKFQGIWMSLLPSCLDGVNRSYGYTHSLDLDLV